MKSFLRRVSGSGVVKVEKRVARMNARMHRRQSQRDRRRLDLSLGWDALSSLSLSNLQTEGV